MSAGCRRPQWPGGGCCVPQSASLCRPGRGRTAQHSAVSARAQFTSIVTAAVPCCPVANLILPSSQNLEQGAVDPVPVVKAFAPYVHKHVYLCIYTYIHTCKDIFLNNQEDDGYLVPQVFLLAVRRGGKKVFLSQYS